MNKIALACTVFFLSACGTQPMSPSSLHLNAPPAVSGDIPEPVRQSAGLSPPKVTPTAAIYSVSVHKVPVQSLLFALARDAKVNIDVYPGITGEVTLNALNQTLPNILNRISKQVDMRYELDGQNISVLPDTPFLRNYKIDYVNISRHTTSLVNIATQISSAGSAVGSSGTANNNSTTAVENKSNNDFWATLVKNVTDILRETDKIFPSEASSNDRSANPVPESPSGDSAATTNAKGPAAASATTAAATSTKATFREAASVIANPENGLIAVRATSRQHERIQEFLDLVMSSAKRQVLIEATVVEVQLNDQYQQGINWESLNGNSSSLRLTQGAVNKVPLSSGVSPGTTAGIFVLDYANPGSFLGNIKATVQLLESFGKVKVVSSPKISVLNNQTAMLKVVDNTVYFTITATTTPGGANFGPTSTYTSTLNTVPVGFVMSVTPQITESDEVTLNVRPSISRIIGYVQDPNPALATAETAVISQVPIIQSREMESILKVSSGQIAVMGGLMQDEINNQKDAVPLLNSLPLIGDVFSYRNENTIKSELVIFIRPIVIKDSTINGDYKEFRSHVPDGAPLNQTPYGEESRRLRLPTVSESSTANNVWSGS